MNSPLCNIRKFNLISVRLFCVFSLTDYKLRIKIVFPVRVSLVVFWMWLYLVMYAYEIMCVYVYTYIQTRSCIYNAAALPMPLLAGERVPCPPSSGCDTSSVGCGSSLRNRHSSNHLHAITLRPPLSTPPPRFICVAPAGLTAEQFPGGAGGKYIFLQWVLIHYFQFKWQCRTFSCNRDFLHSNCTKGWNTFSVTSPWRASSSSFVKCKCSYMCLCVCVCVCSRWVWFG